MGKEGECKVRKILKELDKMNPNLIVKDDILS